MPIAAALLAAAAACGPRIVALEPKKIASVHVLALHGPAMCANVDEVPLRALVLYRDGTTLASRASHGARPDAWIRAGELVWTASLGVVDHGERLIPPPDRLAWLGRPITARAAVAREPTLAGSVTLTPRYDCGHVAATGAGGYGGATGQDGDPGAPGAHVQIALTYVDVPGQRRWVLARVVVDGTPGVRHYVIDPTIPGRFTVDARGGEGGDGGDGSAGFDGSDGSDGLAGSDGLGCTSGGNGGDGGSGGNGGDGGDGGNGGNGGDGGTISLQYDARFPELARLIRYDVGGGPAGAGGSGGRAGSGGSGGKGGRGGRAGSSSDTGPGSTPCHASDGSSGRDGQSGSDGRQGMSGSHGRAGRPGEVRARAADVATLFPDELAHGAPIAGAAPAAPPAPEAP